MLIPYTIEARPDTGLNNAKLGIWLFLASEVMLFGALFSSYILLRVNDPAWPPGSEYLNWKLAMANTFVLIASSITVILSWGNFQLKNPKKGRMYLGITLLCAFIFLVIKYFEYSAKFQKGLFPSENTFLAIYFTLTGLHGLHVVGGIVVMIYFYGPGFKMWNTQPERFTNRIEVCGLYWHFVDLVWIFLFPVLYLL
ncbi:MAG: cytochrome c oxidase subunit 3 [Acidobacteriota bacterium]|nr:cytochrome c oxidase subunit 3 [Acidobacteriota bacterium]